MNKEVSYSYTFIMSTIKRIDDETNGDDECSSLLNAPLWSLPLKFYLLTHVYFAD